MSIKLSISGIRGLYHELDPGRAVKFARAFSTYIGSGDVIIGVDARPSGKFLREAVIAGLTSCGSNVFDYGMMPTPMLQWILKNSPFKGGVSITAGHNTFDWNSLIFLDADGSYLDRVEGDEFFNLYHAGSFETKDFATQGSYQKTSRYVDDYFKTFIPTEGRWKPQKFVIDCSYGFDSSVVENLSEALHIRGIPIFCGKSGFTRKDPEPNIENSGFLGTFVRETGSDGGFLLNSDASRVLVVDERGTPLSEELTLPIFAKMVLESGEKSDIVTNYSTSKIVDTIAAEHNVRVFRTDVGQPYVVQMVRDSKASIGGEGSGSVVYSPFSYGFDAFVLIKKMVGYLRKNNTTISQMARQFEAPNIHKETLFLPPIKSTLSWKKSATFTRIKKS